MNKLSIVLIYLLCIIIFCILDKDIDIINTWVMMNGWIIKSFYHIYFSQIYLAYKK